MRRALAAIAVAGSVLCGAAVQAQSTKQWTTDRFDQMERGNSAGAALRNDGRIEAGPTLTPLAVLPAPYIWSVAEQLDGYAVAGVGGSSAGSAALVQVASDGRQEVLWTGQELGVQVVRRDRDGSLVWATSPDGKVYRRAAGDGHVQTLFDSAKVAAGPDGARTPPKYIWDLAIAADGAVYVATGAPAAVYRVAAGASAPELLFQTTDQHIRSLLLQPDSVLWAGSDGAGVVYRLNTKEHGAKPFAAYAAGRREITALASDTAGDIFLSAVGAKTLTSLPPLPVTGTVGITVTVVQPGSATAAGASTVVPDGSEIDRIASDGTPARLTTLPNDVVYALAVRDGRVLAATGNRGRIYSVDPTTANRFTEIGRVEAGQATALAAGAHGILVGTTNGARLVRIEDHPDPQSTFTSEVFDAGQFSRWGRVSSAFDAAGFTLQARTGNVPIPLLGWSEWRPIANDGTAADLPDGRYAQWRALLKGSSALNAVTMNYLPRNVAPVVDDVVVVAGARVLPSAAAPAPATVQVVFPSAAAPAQALTGIGVDPGIAPLTAQKDQGAVTVRWAAHDDNGDDLLFRVWYRGVGEVNWRMLRDALSDRFLSFDAATLPDGRYQLKVEASDAPEHVAAETLLGNRQSAAFTIDTTPPALDGLSARMEGGRVRWTMSAQDATSPIEHAETSVDGAPWQFALPVGELSDAQTERYNALAMLPETPIAGRAGVTSSTEHVLAVRVFDRVGNTATAKTVVR